MQLTKEITSKPAGKRSEDSKAVVEALKGNIERSQRTLADLKAQVHSKGRLADPNINIEELMSEKRNAEMKLSHSRAHLEQVRDNHRLKEEMFHSEKGFESSLFMNLKTIQQEQTALYNKSRELQLSAGTVAEARERLQSVKNERNRMQDDFDQLMRQPFFKE